MKRLNLIKYSILPLSLALVLMVITSVAGNFYADDAEAYVLTIGNKQLHFVANPQAGYVLKTSNDLGSIIAMNRFIESPGDSKIMPISGSGHKDISIVYNTLSGNQNQSTINSLKINSDVEYAAPLFLSNGEVVGVIPELVVRVKLGIGITEVQTLCKSMNLALIKPMDFTSQEYLIEVKGIAAAAVFTAVEKLNEISFVEWAWPNTIFQPNLGSQTISSELALSEQLNLYSVAPEIQTNDVLPNDEYFPNQWHLYNTGQSGGTPGVDIHAPEAWEITTGDPNIIVAVYGPGVESSHPDLVNNMVPGYDFRGYDDSPEPATNHFSNAFGTAAAGLIAAQGNNGIGVSGVTWNCKIMPIRIFNANSNGVQSFVSWADMAESFRWAANHGADILCNGWWTTGYSEVFQSALEDVTKSGGIGRDGKGCIVTFIAYDSQPISDYYPIRTPEVITVGATDHNDLRCYYSSYGPELDIVSPSAPGDTIEDANKTQSKGWLWTTDITGIAGLSEKHSEINLDPEILDYTISGNTGPIVAGVAALILSVEPNLTNEEVRHFLTRSTKDLGDPGKDDYYGWGRVDARAALDMVFAKRCDLNNNYKVDLDDFLILLGCWDTNDLSGDIAPAAKRDGLIDLNDFELMLQYWQTEIPEPGLIAHWKLDETEEDIAYDCINHRDGTLKNGPAWQPDDGMIDGALEFDGINDYVSTPFVGNPADGPFSIFAWIKGGAPGQVILSQIGYKNLLSVDSSSGYLMAEIKGSGRMEELVSETVITDGTWHHIGLVWDGSYRTLYVDDVIAAQDISAQTNFVGSTNGLYIGAGKGLESASFWTGLIDDVRIYDQVIIP